MLVNGGDGGGGGGGGSDCGAPCGDGGQCHGEWYRFARVLACGSRVARRPWGISIIIINIIIDTVIFIIMIIRMPSDIAIASAILKLTQ